MIQERRGIFVVHARTSVEVFPISSVVPLPLLEAGGGELYPLGYAACRIATLGDSIPNSSYFYFVHIVSREKTCLSADESKVD